MERVEMSHRAASRRRTTTEHS